MTVHEARRFPDSKQMTVEVILEDWHDDVGRGGQRRQDLDRRQPRVDVVDNLSLTDKQPVIGTIFNLSLNLLCKFQISR